MEFFGVVWLYADSLNSGWYWFFLVIASIMSVLVGLFGRVLACVVGVWWHLKLPFDHPMHVSAFTGILILLATIAWIKEGGLKQLIALMAGYAAVRHISNK